MRLNTVLGAILLGLALPVAAQNADSTNVNQQPQETAVSETSANVSEANQVDVLTENKDNHSDAKSWADQQLSMDEERAIRKTFEARFPGIKVDTVRFSPMPGIYEVQVGLDLLYTDAAVDYVLQGSLIDAQAKRDITAERLEQIQKVAFDSLPLDDAIKQVKGNGEHVFAIFEDPNCGYCKQLHKSLEEIDNTTIYTFLFPILTPDSSVKSRDIWCSEDPAKTWRDWMVKDVKPASAECETPIESNLDLGRKLKVQGTPAMFFTDGSRIKGALPLEDLKQKFASASK